MTENLTLIVKTDRNDYTKGDHVSIRVYTTRSSKPAHHQPVIVTVIAPTGSKIYRTNLQTDKEGSAVCIYKTRPADETGHYYIEARSRFDSMALNSFVLLK